jgi:hypothetical protein
VLVQTDRTMQTTDIAGLSAGSTLYYLVIIVQARGDYGGKMLETMREVCA